MNIENFKTQLKAFCADHSILPNVIDQWCDIVQSNYQKFEKRDFDGIFEAINSLAIVGVDEQIIKFTASAIAYYEDAEMNTDKGCSTVFMAYSKSINK